jgi:Tol biopolymer transport system component
MRRSGRGVTLLSRAASLPSWSPQESQLALVDEETRNLSILHTTTMERRTCLPEGWQPDAGVSWSADARRLCFRLPGYRAEPAALVIVPSDAPTPSVRLKGTLGPATAWSPDSQTILVALRSTPTAPFQLVLVPVDPQIAPRVLPGQPTDRSNEELDWSADGQWIIFTSRPWAP